MSSDFYATSIVPFAPIIIKICRAYTNTQEDFEVRGRLRHESASGEKRPVRRASTEGSPLWTFSNAINMAQ